MLVNLKTVDKGSVQDVQVTQRKLSFEFKPLVDNLKNRSKPLDLVWDSVRFGKVKRLYYYCKKNRIWNNAYRVNEGYNHNYYVKFGIHSKTHDPKIIHELQAMTNDPGHTKPILSNHEDAFILSLHVPEMFFSYWEAMNHQHSSHQVQYPGQAFSYLNHETSSHQSYFHLNPETQTFFQTYSLTHLSSSSYHHSDHSHSSDSSGHFSWFFQSFWNMVGMNPYAICVSKHTAHDPKVDIGSKWKSDAGSNKHKNPSAKYDHSHPSTHASESGRAESKSVFLNCVNHQSHNQSHYRSNSSQHIQNMSPVHGMEKRSQTKEIRESKSGDPKVKSESSITDAIRMDSGSRPQEIIIAQPYISSRIPKKIVSQAVIGAEALPE